MAMSVGSNKTIICGSVPFCVYGFCQHWSVTRGQIGAVSEMIFGHNIGQDPSVSNQGSGGF